MCVRALVGFAVAAGQGFFDLLTLSSEDGSVAQTSLAVSAVGACAGLIELGWGAKGANLGKKVCSSGTCVDLPDDPEDKIKALFAFTIIAGGFSLFVFLLKVLMGRK